MKLSWLFKAFLLKTGSAKNGLKSGIQILQYGFPVRELGGTEVNPFSAKMVGAVFGTVVDEVTAFQEILVVAENEPFGEVGIQVVLDPIQFVRPS